MSAIRIGPAWDVRIAVETLRSRPLTAPAKMTSSSAYASFGMFRGMDLSATIKIKRPVSEVYEFVADPSNDVQWRTGITDSGLTTEPPLELGSEGFATAGDKVTVHWKVVEFMPESSVDWQLLDGPIEGYGGYRFVEEGDSTKFTLVANVKPSGFLRFMGPLFRRAGVRQNQQDVERLRDLLETGI